MRLNTRYLKLVGVLLLTMPLVWFLQQSLNYYFAGESINPHNSYTLAETSDGKGDLPQSWHIQRGNIETRVFNFEINLNLPTDARQAIYFPAFDQRLRVEINGKSLNDRELLDSWYGPLTLATAFVELPTGMLRTGKNEIKVSVEAGPLITASLAPFLIGDFDELLPVAKLRKFMGVDLAEMLLGIHFLLVVIVFSAMWQHPLERGFRWILLALIPSTLFSLGVMADYIPQILELTPFLFTLSVLTAAGLYGFSYAIDDLEPPRWLRPLLVVYLAVVVPITWFFPGVVREVVFIAVIPLFLFLLAATLHRTIHLSVTPGGAGYYWITFGVALVLLCTIRDWLFRAGLITDGVFLWTSPVRSIVLIGVTIVLLARMGSRTEAVRLSNLEITERLWEQEQELEKLYVRREKSKEREAIAQERYRILKELHDGVAGQLVVISTLAAKSDLDAEAIRSVSRSALIDLRTVVNTLAIKETDLLQILGIFREKYLSQLESLGVKINWDLLHSPEVFGFNSQDALNLIRILQEALNNSVKHSELSAISVSVKELENDDSEQPVVQLCFESQGTAAFEPVKLGLGLRNIAERAEQFGASVDFEPTFEGLRVVLLIRVKRSDAGAKFWLDREGYRFDLDDDE